jgi:hypothetical protein
MVITRGLESLINSCTIEQGISDYCEVLLEVEWEENYCRPEVESLLAVYNTTTILSLHTFLREKFSSWASNGTCVEEVWINFKVSLRQGIEKIVPHKMPRKKIRP